MKLLTVYIENKYVYGDGIWDNISFGKRVMVIFFGMYKICKGCRFFVLLFLHKLKEELETGPALTDRL